MEKVNLGEYVNIKTGKLDANASNIDGKYPFFTCSNEPLRINEYSYDCECVLVAGNGDLNVKYYNGKFNAYQRTYIIEPKDKQLLNTKYLYYLISSNIDKLRKNAIGGVIKYIKLGNLTNIKIKLIDLNNQRKIVNALDKIQEIIDLRKKQIDELHGFIKSQFVEMFGNVKKNEKQWQFTTIGKECILNPRKSELQNIFDTTKVSFVAMQSVSENGNINTGVVKEYGEVKKGFTYFRDNDVLFAKITPCMENGKGAVARGLKSGIGFGSTEFHILRPKEKVNSIWLYTLISMKSFRIEAERKMTGSAGQKRVPITFFENYKFGNPPIELQNRFAEIVKQINKQIFELEKNLKEMENLQESIMNKYFEGE